MSLDSKLRKKYLHLPLKQNGKEFDLDRAYERYAFMKSLEQHKLQQLQYERILRHPHDIDNEQQMFDMTNNSIYRDYMTNNSIYINHKDRQTNARDPVSEIHRKRTGFVVCGPVMDVTGFFSLYPKNVHEHFELCNYHTIKGRLYIPQGAYIYTYTGKKGSIQSCLWRRLASPLSIVRDIT